LRLCPSFIFFFVLILLKGNFYPIFLNEISLFTTCVILKDRIAGGKIFNN
jgi:hypothetical protein